MTVTDLPLARRSERELYRRAVAGLVVAEELPGHLRWRLVADLNRAGLTDSEIAEHTTQTSYTVARIRSAMGLEPNRSVVDVPAPRRSVS